MTSLIHIFHNRTQGFTLIELLLYIAIASVILLTTAGFLATLLSARVKHQTIAEVEGQGRVAMELILQTIRTAELITLPATSTSASSLVLNVVSGGLDPTIFDSSGGIIRSTEGAGASVALTNTRVSATNLMFLNLSRAGTPGAVRVSFTLSLVNSSGRNEYEYSKTFYGSASLRQP